MSQVKLSSTPSLSRSICAGYPTPPAMGSNYTYSQVIILLTDGLNTQDRWYTNEISIDNRQAMTCSNIKAAGITLYTIQVNTSGDPTSSAANLCERFKQILFADLGKPDREHLSADWHQTFPTSYRAVAPDRAVSAGDVGKPPLKKNRRSLI